MGSSDDRSRTLGLQASRISPTLFLVKVECASQKPSLSWVGEEELPGLAGVGGFVEAGEVAFAAGHDDGGLGVEGLDAAEVEVFGLRVWVGAGLPGGSRPSVVWRTVPSVPEAQATLVRRTAWMPRREAVVWDCWSCHWAGAVTG